MAIGSHSRVSMRIFVPALAVLLMFFFLSAGQFYTHDDFFLLKISHLSSVLDFISFFSPFSGPDGLGMYRPLTIQVYYSLAANLLLAYPVTLRLLSLAFLLATTYLVIRLAGVLVSFPASRVAGFLYLLSASHFAHLSYPATFQELGMTVFVLSGLLTLLTRPGLSILFMFLALLSKETAIVFPVLVGLLYLFFATFRSSIGSVRRLILLQFGYAVILAVYAYFRFFHYGFATGDSYSWEISSSIVNTLFWYLLWSFNTPEFLVDYVGPGANINPNLFLFWGREVLAIIGLLGISVALLLTKIRRMNLHLGFFAFTWFAVSLGPLLFLPWHKFAFYLTLPLVGLVIFISDFICRKFDIASRVFLIAYSFLFIITWSLTLKTHWIPRGQAIAARVHSYVSENLTQISGTTLVFYDDLSDKSLPWSPAETLKTTLSDSNYFRVFYPGFASVVYLKELPDKISPGMQLIPARQFLGY